MNDTLTVQTIDDAMKGNAFWLEPNSDAARIVIAATRAGYVKRLSHTQVQWTEEGLARARAELSAAPVVENDARFTRSHFCVCDMLRVDHKDGDDGDRIHKPHPKHAGSVTYCQGFQAKAFRVLSPLEARLELNVLIEELRGSWHLPENNTAVAQKIVDLLFVFRHIGDQVPHDLEALIRKAAGTYKSSSAHAITRTVGARFTVSHGRYARKDGSGNCYGGIATVLEAHADTFKAACACGWEFSTMHDYYINVERAP